MLFKSKFIQIESKKFYWHFILCTEKCMEHSTKNNHEIIYQNTFWMDMSKIDKLKIVKIARRQFASNDN